MIGPVIAYYVILDSLSIAAIVLKLRTDTIISCDLATVETRSRSVAG